MRGSMNSALNKLFGRSLDYAIGTAECAPCTPIAGRTLIHRSCREDHVTLISQMQTTIQYFACVHEPIALHEA